MRDRIVNLTFHGIGDTDRALDAGERDVWISRARFSQVLDTVGDGRGVALTFDDGNRSDLEIAVPELVARGLTATFFVCAARVGASGFLSADDVRALIGAGMTVGSHGLDHRPWRTLTSAELEREVNDSRRELEQVTGRQIGAAACPFGSYDRRVLAALRACGYERVYTSDRGTATPGAWLQARNSVTEQPTDTLAQARTVDTSRTAALKRTAKLTVKRWR